MNDKSIILFSRKQILSLHDEAMTAAKNLKSEYQKLFDILLLVETKQIYLEFDIPTFRTYCKEMLQLSDSIAREFAIVIRKSLEVPQLAEAIREGKISIYKARRISSVITEANHKEWIGLAAECSARIVERTVAMANPRDAAPESLRYVSGDVLDFRMGVSEEWAKLLERTKDLFCQKYGRVVSAEEALFNLMSEHCRKNDPLEKAKRAEKRKLNSETKQTLKNGFVSEIASHHTPNTALQVVSEPAPSTCSTPQDGTSMEGGLNTQTSSASKPRSRYIPAEVEHQVDLRDGCQCTHVDKNGNRCRARRWLQKHHIVEFADGGEHTIENLITLCWGHHKIRHLKSSH